MRKTLLFAAALAFAAAATAQQYKWVDRNGRTQYGDAPPPGVKATPLRGPAGPAAPPSASATDAATRKGPMTPAEMEADFRKRKLEAEKAQEKQAAASQEAAAKKENCQRAQAYLQTLESGQRIARTDAKGERYYLEDADIAREKTEARQSVQSWCK
jgi:hypothetical protein